MTKSDWNALSDAAQQNLMNAAYEDNIEIEIGGENWVPELEAGLNFSIRNTSGTASSTNHPSTVKGGWPRYWSL